MGTKESDPVSIMCYHLPASIMKDRKAVKGGIDINPRDFAFAASLYPKEVAASKTTVPPLPEPRVSPAEIPEGFTSDDVFYLSVLAPRGHHAPR